MAKTLQERLDYVNDPGRFIFLQMTRPLKEGTLKNKVIGDSCTGYTFQLDNLSYRGIWVSTLEDIELTVDGVDVPKDRMLFRLGGLCIPICDLGGHTEVFWGAKDTASIDVYTIGGLKPGEHKFEIVIKKRADFGHSYGEAEQGYDTAYEFHTPGAFMDEAIFTI